MIKTQGKDDILSLVKTESRNAFLNKYGNDEYKNSILIFYELLKKCTIDKNYTCYYWHHTYIEKLALLRFALIKEDYEEAWNYICELTILHNARQERIKTNLLYLIEEYVFIDKDMKMFCHKKGKYPSSNNIEGIYKFLMQDIEYLSEGLPKEELIDLYDYIILVLGNDLVSSIVALPLYNDLNDISWNFGFPDMTYDENGKEIFLYGDEKREIDILKTKIFYLTWSRKKLKTQLKQRKKGEFVYHKENHRSYYFPELDICAVTNGNHSIAASIFHKKDGYINATVYNMELAFKYIHTDGLRWFHKYKSNRNSSVNDFRLAALFEVARLKYEIIKS